MGPEQRLHRAGIAVYALSALREGLFPLFVVLAVSVLGGGLDAADLVRGVALAIAGGAVAAVAGLVRWSTTYWSVSPSGIHHRSGIVSKKEIDVPFTRVQSLDTTHGPVQRLFGVQALHVQTGGGGAGGEIVLDAVAPEEVRALRERLAEHRPETVAEVPEAGRTRRLGRGTLLVAALTSGQIGVIAPVLAGLGPVIEGLLSDRRRGEEAFRLLPDTTGELGLAIAVLLVIAWLLSALGAIVSFSGFVVTREEDRLRIQRGLVQRRDVTLPVGRVRAVRVVEGVLRQPFGLATVRLVVIGHAKEPAAAQTLFPLLRRREVEALLGELLPELAADLGGLARPPRRAVRRYVLEPALAGLALGALACLIPGAGLWPLLAALPGAGWGLAAWRTAGWRLDGERLRVRARRLAVTTVLAPAANRESHALAQTVLQRRGELADLGVAFGKATTARVRHLDSGVAWRLWDEIGALR